MLAGKDNFYLDDLGHFQRVEAERRANGFITVIVGFALVAIM